jgi:hypothetical protein
MRTADEIFMEAFSVPRNLRSAEKPAPDNPTRAAGQETAVMGTIACLGVRFRKMLPPTRT